MALTQTRNHDVAILTRLIDPEKPNLSPEMARLILDLSFSPADRCRMNELAAKAREGALTPSEKEEIDSYERIGHFLGALQSKARKVLREAAAS